MDLMVDKMLQYTYSKVSINVQDHCARY